MQQEYQTRKAISTFLYFLRDLGKFFKGALLNIFNPAFLCVLIPLLLLWEFLPRFGVLDRNLVHPFSSVMTTLFDMFVNGGFFWDVFDSLIKVFHGLFLAILFAIPIGTLMGWNEAIRKRTLPLFQMLSPIPAPAWFPIAIIFLGIGYDMQVFLIFIGTFFPMLINTYHAVKDTEPRYIASARSFGASELTLIFRVYIPASMVAIISSLKTGVSMGLVMLVIAEMYGGRTGIGFVMNEARQFFRVPVVMASMVTFGSIGWFIVEIIKFIELKLSIWKGGR